MVKLYIGGIRPLPPGNEPSGIFKQACLASLWLGAEGLAGDEQADRRVHGGVEKALHQYPVSHYARLAAAFADAAPLLAPGSMGENLSVAGWDEDKVCIGDLFRLGGARIQVSQPRSPCWKIDRRYGCDGMMKLIAEIGLTGWYFRVVEPGAVAPDCAFDLLERPAPDVTVARLWTLWRSEKSDPRELATLAATPGLSPNWVKKLADRAAPVGGAGR